MTSEQSNTSIDKIDAIRTETLRAIDREIESAEYEIRNHLQWVEERVADARRAMEDPNGSRPSNGFLMRNSAIYEADLAAARCAALKSVRREIAAIIDWVAKKE